MRFKMTVEYDGTDFVGWQREGNGPSGQAGIEDALTAMHGGDRAPTPPYAARGGGVPGARTRRRGGRRGALASR